MSTLILFLCVIFALFFPAVRVVLKHPIKVVKNAIVDVYKYFRYRRWRECKAGKHYGVLNIYTGHGSEVFGSGKSLSVTRLLIALYHRYNGLKVWNDNRKQWEIQEIRIVSNVELKGIPYVKLASTEDIINCHKGLGDMSVALVLLDEAGGDFNSRNFKTNISSTLLKSMLTCRHEKFGMFLTSQRFEFVDALMRQICCNVIECRKVWRFQLFYICSAHDLENCTNIKLVKHKRKCWFVENKHYQAYDTNATVEDIKRKQKNGELLSDAELLELQARSNTDVYRVSKQTRKMKKITVG